MFCVFVCVRLFVQESDLVVFATKTKPCKNIKQCHEF